MSVETVRRLCEGKSFYIDATDRKGATSNSRKSDGRNRQTISPSGCESLRWGVTHTGSSSSVVSIINVHWCEVQADEILPWDGVYPSLPLPSPIPMSIHFCFDFENTLDAVVIFSSLGMSVPFQSPYLRILSVMQLRNKQTNCCQIHLRHCYLHPCRLCSRFCRQAPSQWVYIGHCDMRTVDSGKGRLLQRSTPNNTIIWRLHTQNYAIVGHALLLVFYTIFLYIIFVGQNSEAFQFRDEKVRCYRHKTS